MARILSILIVIFFSNFSYAEISNETRNKYFYVGKMKSYNSQFTLYFKTRDMQTKTTQYTNSPLCT